MKTIHSTQNKNKVIDYNLCFQLLVLKKYLCMWSKSPQNIKILTDYVQDQVNIDLPLGSLGLSNRWRIINNIFAYSDLPIEEKWRLFELQAKLDGTDEVVKHRRFVTSLLGDHSQLWQYFLSYNKEESVQMAEEAMSAFNHQIHSKLLVAYESKFFEALTEIFKVKDSEYAKAFYNQLYPRDDNLEYYIE